MRARKIAPVGMAPALTGLEPSWTFPFCIEVKTIWVRPLVMPEIVGAVNGLDRAGRQRRRGGRRQAEPLQRGFERGGAGRYLEIPAHLATLEEEGRGVACLVGMREGLHGGARLGSAVRLVHAGPDGHLVPPRAGGIACRPQSWEISQWPSRAAA